MHRRIDISARHDDGGWAADVDLARQNGSETNGARTLHRQTFFARRMADAGCNLVFGNQHDLMEELLAERECHAVLQSNPAAQRIRQRFFLPDGDGPAGCDRRLHGRTPLHGNADDPCPGLQRLDRDGDTARKATAGKRNEHRCQSRHVFDNL